MHPAYSVILLTTASGAGYGLLTFLTLSGAYGLVAIERWLGFVGFGLGFALVTTGLLASTFHLGHPERAWRALSQWRSSWLSREGVAAIASYVPSGLMALLWVFAEDLMGFGHILAWLTAILALATVYSQSMIYGSLRTIPAWNRPLVPFVFLALALATGGILFLQVANLFGYAFVGLGILVLILVAIGGIVKYLYWRDVATMGTSYTAGQATGLGGTVRPLDPPHTQPNFVMREMGYQVARKHAGKLRQQTYLLLLVAPFLLILASFWLSTLAPVLLFVAAMAAAVGVFTERWLFFAEAKHLSMLYYGEQAV